jgi:multidrug efflux pump subunit AcrA (membrane-fusion protein)
MRITAAQRADTENRIRTAMDRLLRGEIPPDGHCDTKTLAREAGIDRTAFYGKRPYAHLREEFEQRLEQLRHAGTVPDARAAQITRLKNEVTTLKARLADTNRTTPRRTTRGDPPTTRSRGGNSPRHQPRHRADHANRNPPMTRQRHELRHTPKAGNATQASNSAANTPSGNRPANRYTKPSAHGHCGQKAHQRNEPAARRRRHHGDRVVARAC